VDDDTSMALALANSIATAGWDLNDQAEAPSRSQYRIVSMPIPDHLAISPIFMAVLRRRLPGSRVFLK
jgi:hypothetical protein